MSDSLRNKISAQIIKAEMLGDNTKVASLKAELAKLQSETNNRQDTKLQKNKNDCVNYTRDNHKRDNVKKLENGRIRKFIDSTSSLSSMFVNEKKLSTSDETKMYMKTAAKFSREDMETKFFSEEIDDSQVVLNKSKKQRVESKPEVFEMSGQLENDDLCENCSIKIPHHLIIEDDFKYIYVSVSDSKPFLSSLSSVIIRSNDHTCDSFVSSSNAHQTEVEELISRLGKVWKAHGYRCLALETHFRNRQPSSKEVVSCGKHFQIHCIPLREKYIEKSRMCFKQAIQSIESESSSNKKIIQTDEKRIQRYLPVGLSYFWICFESLKKGFGIVIESERNFSRYFGYEVLASMLDKEFDPSKLLRQEKFKDQFERCRDFKLMYSKFR